jgi:hypothetical protein
MTHHVMNQMGHQIPNMIGVKPGDLDRRVRKFLPGYMTMGEAGMAEMGDDGNEGAAQFRSHGGSSGPHDYITMGGMYTNIKIREKIEDYNVDPAGIKDRRGRWRRWPSRMICAATASTWRRSQLHPGLLWRSSSARCTPGSSEPRRQMSQVRHWR